MTQCIEQQEIVDLAGYQVTKAELFAHTREPAVTLWENKMKFNMACLRKFPGVTHIQVLVHPEQRRMIIKPCSADSPDSIRWRSGGTDAEAKARDLRCEFFSVKVFDLMGWKKGFKYKMLGVPAIYENEVLYLFKLDDFELFQNKGKGKSMNYFPFDWRDRFGVPYEKHEETYRVDLADGYVSGTGPL